MFTNICKFFKGLSKIIGKRPFKGAKKEQLYRAYDKKKDAVSYQIYQIVICLEHILRRSNSIKGQPLRELSLIGRRNVWEGVGCV